jgi:lipopolysaccharide assembly protein A
VQRVLVWVVMVVTFVALLGFALKNMDNVAVRYFLGFEWQAPLVLVLLMFFAFGIAFGIIASIGVILAQRRRIAALTRELRSLARSPAPADPA